MRNNYKEYGKIEHDARNVEMHVRAKVFTANRNFVNEATIHLFAVIYNVCFSRWTISQVNISDVLMEKIPENISNALGDSSVEKWSNREIYTQKTVEVRPFVVRLMFQE